MKNIIILGSSGKLGLELANYLKDKNKIFTDTAINTEKIMTIDFINENNINCIINCVGSTKKRDYFFHSNFIFTSFLSEKLKEFDLNLNQKFTFIHMSTIGVNAPYMKYNFKKFAIDPFRKQLIKYNSYELSKSCGEYNLKTNLKNLKNIKTIILQPSIIIFKKSIFLKKLKIFLTIFPIGISKKRKLPITPIELLLKEISEIVNTSTKKALDIKKIYKRKSIYNLFKNYSYISFLKIKFPVNFLKKIINLLPEIFFIKSLKRFIIFTFIL